MNQITQFLLTTYDYFTFDIYRFLLHLNPDYSAAEYDVILKGVGTEESYLRCCCEDHASENLFYAMYELAEAKKEGRNFESIEPYYGAVGLKIDKIISFSETDTTTQSDGFTEYNADIGFVCGDRVLIVRESVNILFMNDRRSELPQTDISALFGKRVIGKTIRSVTFLHKEAVKGCGQPTIVLRLSNGKKIKFTHNFGECPVEKLQSRFWME